MRLQKTCRRRLRRIRDGDQRGRDAGSLLDLPRWHAIGRRAAADKSISPVAAGRCRTVGVGIAMGSDGTIYVTGGTNTIDMPVTRVAAQTIIGGESDGFVARINPSAAGAAGLMYCHISRRCHD